MPHSRLLGERVSNSIRPSVHSWLGKMRPGNLVRILRELSLSHSGEDNSRSGPCMAGRGQQPRPPAAWSSQSMGTCGSGCKICWCLAGRQSRAAVRRRSCPLRGFPAPPPPPCPVQLAASSARGGMCGWRTRRPGGAAAPEARSGPPREAAWRCATCFDSR